MRKPSIKLHFLFLGFAFVASITPCNADNKGIQPSWDKAVKEEKNLKNLDIVSGSQSTSDPALSLEFNSGLRLDEFLGLSRQADNFIEAKRAATPQVAAFTLNEIPIEIGGICLVMQNPPAPSCTLTPVVGSRASFTPVSLCDANHTFLTDVAGNGTVVGFYRKAGTNQKFYSFKLQAQASGGYRDPYVLSRDALIPSYPASSVVLQNSFALGISENARTIVGAGTYLPANVPHPMRWPSPQAGPIFLPINECTTSGACTYPTASDSVSRGEASAVNSNGQVIVGSLAESTALNGIRARVWASSSNNYLATQVPDPGSRACGSVTGDGKCWSYARGVSRDGRGVVGFVRDRTDTTVNPQQTQYFPSLGYRWDRLGSPTSTFLLPAITARTFSWAPGAFSGIPLSANQIIERNKRAVFPRSRALNISPDGWAVVGQDSTGQTSYGFRPDGNLPENLYFSPTNPGASLLNLDPNDVSRTFGSFQYDVSADGSTGSPQYTGFIQTIEGFRWTTTVGQPNPYLNSGTLTRAGDLADQANGIPTVNFPFSRFNDASEGGCRAVGSSYAGGDKKRCGAGDVPDSDRFTTAVVRPWIAGSGCGGSTGIPCNAIHPLKDQLNRLLASSGTNIDAKNIGGAQWQLVDASAISADGKVIVGQAVCNGMQDSKIYGFIAYIR